MDGEQPIGGRRRIGGRWRVIALLGALLISGSADTAAAHTPEEPASMSDEDPSVIAGAPRRLTPSDAQAPTAAEQASESTTLLIAGDIAGCDWSGDERTARLIARRDGLVMTIGDNAYPVATLSVLRACYGPSWGRFKSRTHAVLGNHDDFGAFFKYFGRKAGPEGRGYYAFDVGAWRIYALDSNCELRHGCTKGSRQYRWLKRDLEKHRPRCSMAVLHHPTFSSGAHGNTVKTIHLITLLYASGNEIVANGHDHIYERFQRARPWGGVDLEHGMRQFIVGTGGAPLYAFRDGRPPHSQVRQNVSNGVLRLRLAADRYDWEFLAAGPSRFRDTGETACHEPPPPREGR